MSKKILNLKLKYKDKILDIVKQGSDFTNKFVIGSNKYLFWQILDKKFPDKFPILSKTGNRYKINLRPDMDVQVRKNNQVLERDQLKNKKLLSKNSLIIDPETEGEIYISKDWKIEYNYAVPYQFVPTAEEKKIASQFAHMPSLEPQEKFTRIFILLGIVFTFVGLYIADLNYVPPEKVDITDKLQRLEEIATQVQVPEPVAQEPTAGKGAEEEVEEEVEQAAEMTAAEFEDNFGFSVDGGVPGGEGAEDFANQLLEVASEQEITVAGGGGEAGAGQGPGAGAGAGALDNIGGSTTDLSSSGSSLDGLGGLGDFEGEIGVGMEEVDMASMGADAGNYTIHKISSQADLAAVQKKFAGVQKLKEGSIQIAEEEAPQNQSVRVRIDGIINTYKPQLARLYRNETMLMDMHGNVEFVLYISPPNEVVEVQIKPAADSYFTDSFLEKAYNMIMDWKIKVNENRIYTFRQKFYK